MGEPTPRPINLAESSMDENGNFAIRQANSNNLSFMERLDQVVLEEQNKYSPESVERVRQFVQYETENPNRRRPYRLFREVTDYALYYTLHPEWQGRSPAEIEKDKESGGKAFYMAFLKWIRKTEKNGPEREAISDAIFPNRRRQSMKKEIAQGEKTNQFGTRNRNLMERLDEITQQEPGKFFPETIRRVRLVVRHEIEDPEKKKPYGRIFEDISDYQLYFHLHPEWQGRSPEEMKTDRKSGAPGFYDALIKWTREKFKEDVKKRGESIRYFFALQNIDRSYYAIDDWTEEFRSHPEWQGKSPKEMLEDKESGVRAFYRSFRSWVNSVSGKDKKRKRELIEKIFPQRNIWTHFTTVEEWVDEFDNHPEWQEKSIKEMTKDRKSDTCAFYDSFINWIMQITKDKGEQEALKRIIFPNKRRHKERKYLATIDKWLEEFNKHPEWQGRTPTEMAEDKESGAYAFYGAFYRWTRETTKTIEEREALRRIIFPDRETDKEVKTEEKISPDLANEELLRFLEVKDE